jgi:hypothetical protein
LRLLLLIEYKSWRRLTLPRVTAVPSALRVLTSLFGKGRGGHPRHSHHYNLWCVQLLVILCSPELQLRRNVVLRSLGVGGGTIEVLILVISHWLDGHLCLTIDHWLLTFFQKDMFNCERVTEFIVSGFWRTEESDWVISTTRL